MFFAYPWASLWILGTFDFGDFLFFPFPFEFVFQLYFFVLVYFGFHLVLGGSRDLSHGADFLVYAETIDVELNNGTLYCTWLGDGAT